MTTAEAPQLAPDEPPLATWLPGIAVLAVIWGSSFLFIKVGVSELPPPYVALGRVASGMVAVLVILLVRRTPLPRDLAVWGHNAVVATIGMAAPFSLFAYGEQRVSSVLAGLWNSTTPLVVLPLAVLVFRTERLTVRKVVGLGLGFAGALVILGVWEGVGGSSLSGQLMCLGAAACYGVGIPYTKKFISPRRESGLVMTACQLILATAMLVVAAPLLTGRVPDLTALSWQVIASITVLGSVGTGVAFVLHLRNIRLVGATSASMVTYIVPVFATVIGISVLGEDVRWFAPVGAAVVLVGVAVSQGLLGGRMFGRGRARGAGVIPAETLVAPESAAVPCDRS